MKSLAIVGYPTGFLAVQHLNDHHLHYGYFLRAAVAIGRYDPVWLAIYGSVVREMLLDVAAFDNGASGFPQLRNFNPYYGHSWADGSAYRSSDSSTPALPLPLPRRAPSKPGELHPL